MESDPGGALEGVSHEAEARVEGERARGEVAGKGSDTGKERKASCEKSYHCVRFYHKLRGKGQLGRREHTRSESGACVGLGADGATAA